MRLAAQRRKPVGRPLWLSHVLMEYQNHGLLLDQNMPDALSQMTASGSDR